MQLKAQLYTILQSLELHRRATASCNDKLFGRNSSLIYFRHFLQYIITLDKKKVAEILNRNMKYILVSYF